MSLTDFPALVDTFTDPDDAGGDELNTAGVEHDRQHAKANQAIKALQRVSVGPTQYDVEGYSQSTFEARWAAANAEAHAGGGVLVCPPGLRSASTLGSITKKNVWWRGPAGAPATQITATGAGDLVSVRMASPTGDQTGGIEGIQIIGNAGASACGIHMGDVVGFTLRDVNIFGFTGTNGKGLWLDNITYWTEQCTFEDVWLGGSKRQLLFTINGGNQSFGYNKFLNLRMNIDAGQYGFVSQNNAYIYGGDFRLKGNVTGTGQVGSLEGTSFWHDQNVTIDLEHNGGGVGVGIVVASGTAFRVFGVVKLPSLPCSNANAASISPKYAIRGSGEGAKEGNSNDLGSGEKTNIFGSGTTVRVAQVLVSDSDNPSASNGFLRGANIESPFVCMLDAANNAWVVYRLAIGNAPNTMVEAFRVDAYNNVLFQECVAPPPTPASGVYLFVQGGVLKRKDSTGAVAAV